MMILTSKKNMFCFLIKMIVTGLLGVYSTSLPAYEINTHETLTIEAFKHRQAILDQRLTEIGLVNGLAQQLNSGLQTLTIRGWMIQGSIREDLGLRPAYHFHNPLKPLRTAGILGGDQSSISWMLLPIGAQKNLYPLLSSAIQNYYSMSWYDARDYYFKGLTESTEAAREKYLAYTFKALGHNMHLIQDATVPAHVRHDSHIPFLLDRDGFHFWMDDNRFRIPSFGVIEPNPNLLKLPHIDIERGNFLPIANLIDANFYRMNQLDPEKTLIHDSNIGVAEYANANFYSEDTILSQNFIHPSPPGSYDTPLIIPTSPNYDFYFKLLRYQGNPYLSDYTQHLTTIIFWALQPPSFTNPTRLPVKAKYTLEDKNEYIYEDYAIKLIPRAIGYSAELLQYFFRGSLDIKSEEVDTIKIINQSDEDIEGSFSLYYDSISGTRHLVTGGQWTLSLPSKSTSHPQTFTVPTNAQDIGKYLLVYKGKLGDETDAVIGKTFTAIPSKKRYLLILECNNYQCGVPDSREVGFATMTTDTDTVSISALGEVINGIRNNNIVTYSDQYPESGGITTEVGEIVFDSNWASFSGVSEWSWANGVFSCSGMCQLTGLQDCIPDFKVNSTICEGHTVEISGDLNSCLSLFNKCEFFPNEEGGNICKLENIEYTFNIFYTGGNKEMPPWEAKRIISDPPQFFRAGVRVDGSGILANSTWNEVHTLIKFFDDADTIILEQNLPPITCTP